MLDEQERRGVSYSAEDKLEVWVRLYFEDPKIRFVDVDNRAKDVLDALQGRVGGSKKKPGLPPIIPNDNQVYRVVVEKGLPLPQSHSLGHLKIRRFSGGRLRLGWD